MDFFHEAGIVTQTGNGIIALSWTEIKAWIECTGLELSCWEISVIRQMSEAYASQHYKSTDPKCPPPYQKAIPQEEIDQKAKLNKFKNILSGFKKQGNV